MMSKHYVSEAYGMKTPIWIPSRRAKKWAGWGMFFGLEIVGLVVLLLAMVFSELFLSPVTPEFLKIGAMVCFGTPVPIIALAHLFLGIDAANQLSEAQVTQRRLG